MSRIKFINRHRLINTAARLARCDAIRVLDDLCENQKTISTVRLRSMLDDVSNKLKNEAVSIRSSLE
jgi:hypothetical protein